MYNFFAICTCFSKRSVMYMAKLIYRVFLVLAIAAAVWGGVHYVMGVRSGEQLQNGVELVSNMKETLCRG